MPFLDDAANNKIGLWIAIGGAFGAVGLGIIRSVQWLIGVAHQHEQLVEHMNISKPIHLEFPAVKQKVENLEQNHDGLLEEVRGLRKDISDLFKFLIEKHGE